jgi:hypothetical protein
VLLTRSRLCPRPKPGSSLHLHVLGTPPAFVLSQDQTLREELLRRVVRSTTPYIQLGPRSQPATGQVLGPSLVGPDPCTHTPQAKPLVGAQVHSRASGVQDGVNLGTVVRASPEGFRSSDGVEPGHTPRPRNRSKGAHAVEFSKTVAPLQEGIPPQTARPEPVIGSRGGPTSIALEIALNTEFALPGRPSAARRTLSLRPGRQPCVAVADHRNRSGRFAAMFRASGARPPTGLTPRAR